VCVGGPAAIDGPKPVRDDDLGDIAMRGHRRLRPLRLLRPGSDHPPEATGLAGTGETDDVAWPVSLSLRLK